LQEFAFVASHDLQEPLRKIRTFGDLLVKEYMGRLEHKGADYIERMQHAAERMQNLIQDLLAYSRVNTKPAPFSPVDLKHTAHEVVTDLEARILETGAQVEIGDLGTVKADPPQMRQLLQNLIGNALKFHGKGKPLIKVHGRKVAPLNKKPRKSLNQWYEILVEDNGIGFDEKYLDRIFVPFQRLHSRMDYEGTGMGLAICRRIVERHGGTITAKSMPGKGATFITTLPLNQTTQVK
jgi:light-regulated signal transduction histidine kinase (bacteriophytochrome)